MCVLNIIDIARSFSNDSNHSEIASRNLAIPDKILLVLVISMSDLLVDKLSKCLGIAK